jgi:hypothetical protein
MSQILNFISVASSFLFAIGIIYILLDVTLGKLKILRGKYEWNGLQLKDFIFLLVSFLMVVNCIKFHSPY